jgi:putative oxidoreductase
MATHRHDPNIEEHTIMEAIATQPSLIQRVVGVYTVAARQLDRLQPIVALVIRLQVARVFFTSGMIKIGNWTGTLGLFQNEFHVPLLPPHLAAVMGTTAELGLPVFLALGLGTRAAAIALFVFNCVAASSYPDLSVAGLKDHILWGTLLLVTIFYGPGKIALDHWIAGRFGMQQ